MRRLALASCIVVAGLLIGGPTASAGGWAVTTLDPLPSISPDETAVIGFTIRQHGVTPVDLDGVALVVVRSEGGEPLRFPARLEGPTGHYVADLRVPAGEHRWFVEQGFFAAQELGQLRLADAVLTPAPAPAPPAEEGQRWALADDARWGLLVVTLLAAMAFVGLLAWPSAVSRSQSAR